MFRLGKPNAYETNEPNGGGGGEVGGSPGLVWAWLIWSRTFAPTLEPPDAKVHVSADEFLVLERVPFHPVSPDRRSRKDS